ncbi:MAG: acyltransferase [Planctomycetota bacterium]
MPAEPQPLGSTGAPARLDALTGLRFVAAAAVFVYHLATWLRVPGFKPGTLGPAAVGYFFVLSGFILAHVYRREHGSPAPGRFWLARFARVWPLHLACLLLMLALWPATVPTSGAGALHWLAHLFLLQGWTSDPDWALAWNGPAWSLSVEAFFYALFPLLVVRSARTLVAIYLLCCLATAALYAGAEHVAAAHPERAAASAYLASSFPLPRLQEFVLGICANLFYRRHGERLRCRPAWATLWELCALAVAVACFCTWSHGPWGEAWVGVGVAPITVAALASGPGLSWAYAATIVLGAIGGGFVSRALSTPSLVYLGEISFAVYLVHTPVMSVVTERTRAFEFFWHVPLLVGVTTTLAAAAWLHALVEQPARQAILARGVGAAARVRLYLGTAAIAVRSRALVLLTGLAVAAIVVACVAVPTVEAKAARVVADSAALHRGVRYDDGTEVLGANLMINYRALTCWVVLAGDPALHERMAIETRTNDGRLLRTLPARSVVSVAADGRCTTLLTVEVALPEVLGASVLALVVRGAAGALLPPRSGPVGPDGTSLELVRGP